ncbi:MAG: beta-propeller fold lactonase family protein [Sphaerochaetaceae bacterium]|jgi:hypothetical protein|nr:beta-propeller fold lactonase family protein [Sphaerochaetaceae bacterium]
MRKIYLSMLAIALCALLLLASCQGDSGTGTLKLHLTKADAKALLPGNDYPLEVTRYRVMGTGPDNKSFNINTDSQYMTIDGLALGQWSITATGLNSEGSEIVRGSVTHNLTTTAQTAVITLNEMVGSGTLSLSFNWENSEVFDPSLLVYLKGPSGAESQVALTTFNANTKTATYVNTSLAAGSYTVRCILKSGSTIVSGLVEAVRIANSATTQGALCLDYTAYNSGSGSLVLINKAGVPVTGKITGISETVAANVDRPITFSVDTAYLETDGLTISWYYDGEQIGATKPLELTLDDKMLPVAATDTVILNCLPGTHRLDVVVSSALLGSTGSTSISFTAALEGTAGTLALLGSFSDNPQGIRVKSDTMVSPLPGDKFLIVTPSESRIQIARVLRNTLYLLNEYDANDFSFIADISQVASERANGIVALAENKEGASNLSLLKFNSDANTLSLATRCVGFLYQNNSNYAIDKVESIGFSSSASRVFYYDPVQKRIRSVYVDASTAEASVSPFLNLGNATAMTASNTLDVNQAGNRMIISGNEAKAFVLSINSTNPVIGGAPVELPMSESLVASAIGRDGHIVAAGPSGFSRYTYSMNTSSPALAKQETFNVAASKLRYRDDRSTLYAMDRTDSTIKYYSSSASGVLSDLGTMPVGSIPRDFVINGSYMLISTDDSKLVLARIINESE